MELYNKTFKAVKSVDGYWVTRALRKGSRYISGNEEVHEIESSRLIEPDLELELQYYFGIKINIAKASPEKIISTISKELCKIEEKGFPLFVLSDFGVLKIKDEE